MKVSILKKQSKQKVSNLDLSQISLAIGLVDIIDEKLVVSR